ncbi:MAG: protease complex subunit PrcB family protein [Gemmatimonadales bacterium]|nr:protease complex subunit PrcB family protein [Gemmatimonadales bacterium]
MHRFAGFFVLVATAGCAGHQADSPVNESGMDLPVRQLGQWSSTRVQLPERRLIRSASSWAAVWDSISSDPRPQVDFTRETVVLAAAGERRTGGYVLRIAGVRDSAGTLIVTVIEEQPGAGCLTTAALTYPVTVVAVPVVARPARFDERRESRACP